MNGPIWTIFSMLIFIDNSIYFYKIF